MDEQRFFEACRITEERARERSSIGTLGEKSLHAAIKRYFEPHEENHEVQVGDFVADIVGEDRVIEIQTRNFAAMRKKLAQFLEIVPVTVVHPIIVDKTVICIDEQTDRVTSKRKSTKHGTQYDIFNELWGIKPLLKEANLTLCLLMIDATEYRFYGGEREKRARPQRSPKGYFASDRIPTKLRDEIYITCPYDYKRFLPPDLPECFTVRELASLAGINELIAGKMMPILTAAGVCEKVGQRGKAYLYETVI